jgi:hypothetical protein
MPVIQLSNDENDGSVLMIYRSIPITTTSANFIQARSQAYLWKVPDIVLLVSDNSVPKIIGFDTHKLPGSVH